ncbi:MAG: primosomal protein N' [Bacteriovoracaceae bacterium]|nr:primosomal protein N' [Bacteriovoracaceae bacterium]
MNYYLIAVNFPARVNVLTYQSEHAYAPGTLVKIPLGRRSESGCVIGPAPKPDYKTKDITEQISPELSLNALEIKLYTWISQYYHYPLGQVIFDCLPKSLKRPREIKFAIGENQALEYDLSADQAKIFMSLKAQLDTGFSKHLIHGITGSGKTAIYLKLALEKIANKQSVLFLLPEINLTPQFTEFFQKHVSCEICTYHSGVSDSEKYQIWKKCKNGTGPILVLGVRSSIFLPITNLGLIIVDEEHDHSFKQDDRCPYNARDIAIKKASDMSFPIILGSATPMIENYYNYKESKNYYPITKRAAIGVLPKVELVDLRNEKEDREHWPFRKETLEIIKKAFDKNEQVLVFINRLGFSNFMQCSSCGQQFNCPNCSVTLTTYRKRNMLECHHCEYKTPIPTSCPKCSCLTLIHRGYGTEKVEEVLKNKFPKQKIERFDRDEIKTLNDLKDKLDRFHAHKIDLFVGTQMLSKGHNFRRVNTVIILGVDALLNFPDFRSEERVFQLVTQVIGRAGRFGPESSVYIQTFNPEMDLFKQIQSHEFNAFYESELIIRRAAHCPPFTRLAMLYFTHKNKELLESYVTKESVKLKKLVSDHFNQVSLWGPRAAMIEKRANHFTWSLMIKSTEVSQLHQFLSTFEKNVEVPTGMKLKIDIDPYFLS